MTNHCTYEQSQAMKEIGFDLTVRDYYTVAEYPNQNHWSANWNSQKGYTSAPTHAEGRDLEAESFSLAQMPNRSKKD